MKAQRQGDLRPSQIRTCYSIYIPVELLLLLLLVYQVSRPIAVQ